MDFAYVIIGLVLGFLGFKHFSSKNDGAGDAVRRADGKLSDDQARVDAEVKALKDKINNTEDNRDDKEGYWDNN